jgi:hypothetical protein
MTDLEKIKEQEHLFKNLIKACIYVGLTTGIILLLASLATIRKIYHSSGNRFAYLLLSFTVL